MIFGQKQIDDLLVKFFGNLFQMSKIIAIFAQNIENEGNG